MTFIAFKALLRISKKLVELGKLDYDGPILHTLSKKKRVDNKSKVEIDEVSDTMYVMVMKFIEKLVLFARSFHVDVVLVRCIIWLILAISCAYMYGDGAHF